MAIDPRGGAGRNGDRGILLGDDGRAGEAAARRQVGAAVEADGLSVAIRVDRQLAFGKRDRIGARYFRK